MSNGMFPQLDDSDFCKSCNQYFTLQCNCKEKKSNERIAQLDAEVERLRKQLTTLMDCIDDYAEPNPDDDTRQWNSDYNTYHRGCVLFSGGIPPEDWGAIKPLFLKRFGKPEKRGPNMSKHTPGPWRLDKFSDYSVVNKEGTKHVGVVCNKLDGPLFAAAPELLEELKHCQRWHEHHVDLIYTYGSKQEHMLMHHRDQIASITAAITKAEPAAESEKNSAS